MSQPATERNLLFGVLALQLDFIRRDDRELVPALAALMLSRVKRHQHHQRKRCCGRKLPRQRNEWPPD